MVIHVLDAYALSTRPPVPANVNVRNIPLGEARDLADGAKSALENALLAAIFSAELGRHVACARSTVTIQPGDVALVGQYVGPRPPEGATQLPEGARIGWLRVEWN